MSEAQSAHGCSRRAGSLADVATFSFYGNKIVTTGEGGERSERFEFRGQLIEAARRTTTDAGEMNGGIEHGSDVFAREPPTERE